MVPCMKQVWSLAKSNKAADVLNFEHLEITNYEELKEAMQCIKVALLCTASEPSRRLETGKLIKPPVPRDSTEGAI